LSASIRVGIGGWVYPPWRGVFYPAGLPQARELGFASRQVTAIEINGTFYGAQRPASFRRWYSETPEDFVFSLKGPRYATHRRDLATAAPSVDRFFASGVLELREKLGPVLWQFAPWMPFDEPGFNAFLQSLPQRLDSRAIRHVVEIRHRSFGAPAFTELLRRHGVALAFVDDDDYPAFDEASPPVTRPTRSIGGRSASTGCWHRAVGIALSISSMAPRFARPPPPRLSCEDCWPNRDPRPRCRANLLRHQQQVVGIACPKRRIDCSISLPIGLGHAVIKKNAEHPIAERM